MSWSGEGGSYEGKREGDEQGEGLGVDERRTVADDMRGEDGPTVGWSVEG